MLNQSHRQFRGVDGNIELTAKYTATRRYGPHDHASKESRVLYPYSQLRYVMSGITISIPSISSSGNIKPASITTMSFSYCTTYMFFPISPTHRVQRWIICLAGFLVKLFTSYHSVGDEFNMINRQLSLVPYYIRKKWQYATGNLM